MRVHSPIDALEPSKSRVIVCKRPEKGIFGTGHQSVLQLPGTDEWRIVYHRFRFPDAITLGLAAGDNREVCIDSLSFDKDGNIDIVEPSL